MLPADAGVCRRSGRLTKTGPCTSRRGDEAGAEQAGMDGVGRGVRAQVAGQLWDDDGRDVGRRSRVPLAAGRS